MTPLESLLDAEYVSTIAMLSKGDASLNDYIKDKLWNLVNHGHTKAEDKLLECYNNELFIPTEDDETDWLTELMWSRGILSGINLFNFEYVSCYAAKDRVMDPRYHFQKMIDKGNPNGEIGMGIMDYLENKIISAYHIFRKHYETSPMARLCYGLMIWNGDLCGEMDKNYAISIWEMLPHLTYVDVYNLLDGFKDDSRWEFKKFLDDLEFELIYYGLKEEV